ncbi:MAG: hypothetical protein ABSF46_10475 [Terriglobia bacterium]|jgi:hypothetical protein
MDTKVLSRRQFMMEIGIAGALALDAPALPFQKAIRSQSNATSLYNKNWQTAIGLGDEPATIVDRFGQLKSDDANVPELANAAMGGGSRNVKVLIEVGDPPRPASALDASQCLEDGYLPIVRTKLHAQEGEFESVIFSSDWGEVKADYIGIANGRNPFCVKLLCPTTTSITADEGIVLAPDKVLAVVRASSKVEIHNARYNYLTPERNSRVFPSAVAWEGLPKGKCPSSLDSAFSGARTAQTNVEYLFPVAPGETYHVFLGIGRPEWLVGDPGQFRAVTLSVEDQRQIVEFGRAQPDLPILREFTVRPAGTHIRVRALGLEGGPLLSGVWIFDAPADSKQIIAGKHNTQAIYYVPCGRERVEDIISSANLEYSSQQQHSSTAWIQLPYHLHPDEQQKAAAISPEAALSETKKRWNSLLGAGAQFTTGVPRLDNLYKTSLINLFLLRTKYPGGGSAGQDIYVVKPGATVYDSFWYRDGAYIIVAMDVAGYAHEAQKSLRLFTDPGLKGALQKWGQQSSGLWASPNEEWDSQGQALWALGRHYGLTADRAWLESVYDNISRGALWIKKSTDQTKVFLANGQKPIFWGLLPKGVSEDTGSTGATYVYEQDFWGILGIREAMMAAESLAQSSDLQWMSEASKEFQANLLASVTRAYRQVGHGQFIPGDPFDPDLDINGDTAACYPTHFLDARDPMATSSLERIARHSHEGLYSWFKTVNNGDMWTYMTADWAMCYMLRDDLPMFNKLFRAYVNHASPTNGWVECIYIDSRLGTGDMPHGWAAAEYVLLHRNSLVYENENNLELCWGVDPDWLGDGAHVTVKHAPTKFGKVDFDLNRSGATLAFDYNLLSSSGQLKPEKVSLHIPPSVSKDIRSVRVRDKVHLLSQGESVLQIGF